MSGEYYTIKSAAIALGVTPLTLRNWDRRGKLVAYRHPINNYRMYKREQIEDIMTKLNHRRDIPKKIEVLLVDEEKEKVHEA